MASLQFRIQDEKDKDCPLFPEYEGKIIIRGEPVAAGFLEKGTVKGKPVLVVLLQLDADTFVDCQLTAEMYLTMAAGMKGAMDRWGTPWEGA